MITLTQKGLRLKSIHFIICFILFVEMITLTQKGLRLMVSVKRKLYVVCVEMITLTQKGLRLLSPSFSLTCLYSRNDNPDSKGIATINLLATFMLLVL